MGTYYLLNRMPAGANPLGRDNILTIFAGPAAGASVSGQSRMSVSAKSPLTEAVGEFPGRWFLASLSQTLWV